MTSLITEVSHHRISKIILLLDTETLFYDFVKIDPLGDYRLLPSNA